MTKLEEFRKLWDSMDRKCKDAVLHLLMKEYGKKLLMYMRFIDNGIKPPDCEEKE